MTHLLQGGARAVIYTSAIQMALIFAGLFAIIVIGLVQVGGVGQAWRIASQGLRLQFDEFVQQCALQYAH